MIKLYSYFRSSSSYRVRIALNLKNLDHEIVPVNLLSEDHFSEPFTQINAAHKIPVIDHAGKTIAQSVAIIEYLEAVFRETHLYPTTPYERAIARQMCEIVNSDIQPLQNLSVLKKLKKDFAIDDEQKKKWIQHWISLGFESYEALAKQTAGAYSIGDTPSVADCFLIPQVYNAVRFEVEMSLFPTIERINKTALEHPAFIKAHPANQPDTPK